MPDPKTVAFYDAKVGDYVELFSRDKPDRDLMNFINALPEGGTVLDFGCGPGNSAAFMQAKGFKVFATDASKEMVAIAQQKFKVDAVVAAFAELDTTDAYDGVFANFSLLHAPKSEMPIHLENIYKSLRANGLLHLGLKVGNGEKRDHLGRLYTYYQESELTDLLVEAGFTVKSVRTDTAKGMAGKSEPFMIVLANA